MHRRFAAPLFAFAAFAATAVAADEATYEVEFKEHWKAGQIATITNHEASDQEMSMGGNTMKEEHEVLDFECVVRCDAVDDKDKPTKRTVYFKSWKQTKGDDVDESLTGSIVTLEANAWKLTQGKTPGAQAKRWLDKKYAKPDTDPFKDLVPPKLAVGQTWKPDAKVVADAFAKAMEDAPFETSGTEMEIKLLSVEGSGADATGKFAIKVHLPVKSTFKGLPPNATVSKDSAAEITGERSGPLKGATMLGVGRMNTDVKMTITIPQGGAEIEVATTVKGVEETKTVAGGEIPAVKAEEVKPEPAPEAPPRPVDPK